MTDMIDQPDAPESEKPLAPPRPGVRHVKMPFYGVIVSDDRLRARVDRYFHKPMLILALLVLPLLAVELWVPDADIKFSALWWSCGTAFVIIWGAFLIEFVIKISIAESRVEYVKSNWLDLIIIILPVLRPLRAATLAKTSRAFTLRGVGTKAARYVFSLVLGMEATERLLMKLGLKSRKARLDPRQMTRLQLMKELKKLRKLEEAWEDWYEAHQEHLNEHGHDRDFDRPLPHFDDMPDDDGDAEQIEDAAIDPEPARAAAQ